MKRMLYSVKDWEKHFEVAQSKKIGGQLSWVAIPTKHDGKSYRRIMRMERGGEIYAAWILIVQVAAKCSTRGVLADESGPLDPDDLELKTDYPAKIFKRALEILSSPKVGWIVGAEWEQSGSTLPEQFSDESGAENRNPEETTPLPLHNTTGQTGHNRTNTCGETTEEPVLTFPTDGTVKQWHLCQSLIDEFQESYPSLSVLAEAKKALQWVKSSPANRKTAGGMRKFLNGWLARNQNRGGSGGPKLQPLFNGKDYSTPQLDLDE